MTYPIPTHRLGTVPDRVIAEECGVTVHAVYRRRKALGIAGVKPSAYRRFDPVPEVDPYLGKMSDRAIAKATGWSESGIRKRRTFFRIAAWVQDNRVVPPPQGPRIKLSPEWIALLGTVSDGEVERRSGMSTRTVQSIRVRMGIEAYVRPKAVPVRANPVRKASPVKPVVSAPEPKPRPTPAPKPVKPPKPPPAPRVAKVRPAPRVVVPSMSVRRQLRQPEVEPASGVRPEMVAPTPIPTGSAPLLSPKERMIARLAGVKEWSWIRDNYHVSDDEIAELVKEAAL